LAQKETVDFGSLPDFEGEAPDLDGCLAVMTRALERIGLRHLCLVRLTPPEAPLQVVRVLVPGLEDFDHRVWCVGRRLWEYVDGLPVSP
jgi:ribosomal protein S12 methylthiotransferase accessory factor YcaO